MSITFLIPLIAFPIVIFFVAIFAARQMRSFGNMPVFSTIYVKYRLLLSVFTSGLMTFFFGFLFFFRSGFAFPQLIFCIGLFLLLTVAYFYGIKLGWGDVTPLVDTPMATGESQAVEYPEHVVVENQYSSIKVTINTKKRWGLFALSVFPLPIMICVVPLVGFAIVSLLQKSLPNGLNILVGFLVAGAVLYGLYQKIQEVLEFLFDKEIIEIDNSSVRIEKYGSGFKSIKAYPADNIKKITMLLSFAGANSPIKRSPFTNQNIPMLLLWHERGLKRFRYFGRGLDAADAQAILESVYAKFPQYRG